MSANAEAQTFEAEALQVCISRGEWRESPGTFESTPPSKQQLNTTTIAPKHERALALKFKRTEPMLGSRYTRASTH